ncbi:hypothetical protein BC826DRAFT_330963 [Russula brevipes]|nr:hypothetical protein BC826DRAFT_330963 [Russula brevipes]
MGICVRPSRQYPQAYLLRKVTFPPMLVCLETLTRASSVFVLNVSLTLWCCAPSTSALTSFVSHTVRNLELGSRSGA